MTDEVDEYTDDELVQAKREVCRRIGIKPGDWIEDLGGVALKFPRATLPNVSY